jgi:hypothetical protein
MIGETKRFSILREGIVRILLIYILPILLTVGSSVMMVYLVSPSDWKTFVVSGRVVSVKPVVIKSFYLNTMVSIEGDGLKQLRVYPPNSVKEGEMVLISKSLNTKTGRAKYRYFGKQK